MARSPTIKQRRRGSTRRKKCCTIQRNQWRQWARKNDLIPQRSKGYIPKPPASKAIDTDQQFRLLHLPPEIRESIYVYYMESWSKQTIPATLPGELDMPVPPYEPPLTRTCRLVREESIPVFYSTFRFPLILHPATIIPPYHSFKSVDWYHDLSPDKLAQIRKLEIFFCLRTVDDRPADAGTFHVDLDPASEEEGLRPMPLARKLWAPSMSFSGENDRSHGLQNLYRALSRRTDRVTIALASGDPFTVAMLDSLVPNAMCFEPGFGYGYF